MLGLAGHSLSHLGYASFCPFPLLPLLPPTPTPPRIQRGETAALEAAFRADAARREGRIKLLDVGACGALFEPFRVCFLLPLPLLALHPPLPEYQGGDCGARGGLPGRRGEAGREGMAAGRGGVRGAVGAISGRRAPCYPFVHPRPGSRYEPVPAGTRKLECGHFSQSNCISPARPGRQWIEEIEFSLRPERAFQLTEHDRHSQSFDQSTSANSYNWALHPPPSALPLLPPPSPLQARGIDPTELDLHPQRGASTVHQCNFLELAVTPRGSAPVVKPHHAFPAGQLVSLPAGNFDVVVMSLVRRERIGVCVSGVAKGWGKGRKRWGSRITLFLLVSLPAGGLQFCCDEPGQEARRGGWLGEQVRIGG
jgi:hypothetical protein